MDKNQRLLVLMPVYNDWEACWSLLAKLNEVVERWDAVVDVLVINDGGSGPTSPPPSDSLSSIKLLQLKRNLGHQRAICCGLVYASENLTHDIIVVMDADGEDSPNDVPRLVAAAEAAGNASVIFAERRRRSESWLFQICYHIYRHVHRLLTGHRVRVGNFSAIPRNLALRLTLYPELWSHYAATVFVSKVGHSTIPTHRQPRLGGRSTMNFVGLVTHGLTAISVFSERVGVRLLLVSLFISAMIAFLLGGVVGLHFYANWSLPNWAPWTAGVLLVALSQSLAACLAFCFIILHGRHQLSFLPARDASLFIDRCEMLASCHRATESHQASSGYSGLGT